MLKFDQFFKPVLGLFIAGCCLKGIIGLQTLRLESFRAHDPSYDANQAQAESVGIRALQRIPTFGFKNLASDWAYLRFVQYFGDEPARQKSGYKLVPAYFAAVVHHDPRFIEAFLTLSPACSLFAGHPEQTVRLLGEALKSMTIQNAPKGAYYVWFYKGIDEMLFLGALEAARESYQNAAQWAKAENTPESQSIQMVAQQTSLFLAQNPDSRRARIGAWANLLGMSSDPRVQEIATQQITKLGGKIAVIEQNGARRIQVSAPKPD